MKLFTISQNDAEQRLDKFLKKLFPRATRSLIYKFNRKGKIKVQNSGTEGFQKRDNEYRLQVGDVVKIFLSDKDFDELAEASVNSEVRNVELKVKLNPKDIVYEDGDLLVLNKNPGINVHPGDHKTKEVSVIEQVQDYLGEKLNSLTFKPSLVHRIDRDTSGILLIAKTKPLLTRLVNDFKDHKKVTKTYVALCVGHAEKQSGVIDAPLRRIENATKENKVQVDARGQKAVTHYLVLEEYQVDTGQEVIPVSLVQAQLETGRMHQIRVHLASI